MELFFVEFFGKHNIRPNIFLKLGVAVYDHFTESLAGLKPLGTSPLRGNGFHGSKKKLIFQVN